MDDNFDAVMVLISDKAKEWGIHRSLVTRFCEQGRIPGAQKTEKFWLIPKDAQKPGKKKKVINSKKAGYVTIREKAKEWGLHHYTVKELAINGKIPGAVPQSSRLWIVPKLVQKPDRNKICTIYTYYATTSEKAEEWGVTARSVLNWAKGGLIEDALEFGGQWFIPRGAALPSKKERKKE